MTPEPRWAFALDVQATLRDTDGLGHVNNGVYLSWFEEVRTLYVYSRRGMSRMEEFDFILAAANLEFRSPVLMHEHVTMRCAPVRIGTTSWDLAYEGRAKADGRLVVEGRSVQVQYDYATRKPAPIPPAWRQLLEADIMRSS